MKTMRRFIGSTNSSVPARQRLTLGSIFGALLLMAMAILPETGNAEASKECDTWYRYVFSYHDSRCTNPYYPTWVERYKVYCNGDETLVYSGCIP